MDLWELYKKWFFAWESATARYLEQWLQSPLVLQPAGAWLSAAFKAKAAADRAAADWWGMTGLPTKRDQERMLYAIGQLQSRLVDLEEQLAAERDAGASNWNGHKEQGARDGEPTTP